MEEIFKVCFENYEISNYGNLRRLLKNGEYKIIKGSIDAMGYRYIQFNRKKKRNNMKFHTLVCKCFIGEKPKGYITDHIDRNRLNNHIDNLRYCTYKENANNCGKFNSIIPSVLRRREIEHSKYICECGSTIIKRGIARHCRSLKHKEFKISSLNKYVPISRSISKVS